MRKNQNYTGDFKVKVAQAYIALALQLVALVFVAKFGEHIYAKNVLSYSDEKIFKQFIQNLKK